MSSENICIFRKCVYTETYTVLRDIRDIVVILMESVIISFPPFFMTDLTTVYKKLCSNACFESLGGIYNTMMGTGDSYMT